MTLRDIGRSIVAFLRRFIHRPGVEISKTNLTSTFGLLAITILALLIRLLPMIGFEILLRAFDPWYAYREVEYIIENGIPAWFGWYDTSTWVPYGRNIPRSSYPGIPFTTVLMYYGLSAVGIHVDALYLCVIFPPIMGTLGVIAMYFLGKEAANKEVGLFAAFFMAIIPAYTQRTIAGFYDNEAVGIFAIILTLFFFLRAHRKGSVAYSIFGGLALGYLSASWSVYIYIFELLAIYALLMILLRRYSRRLLLAYSGTIVGGFLIAVCVPRIGPNFVNSTTGIIPLGILGLMVLIELWRCLRISEWHMPRLVDRTTLNLRPFAPYIIGAMCALIVVGLGYLFQSGLFIQLAAAQEGGGSLFTGLAGKFLTVLDPFIRKTAQLLASVGEHLPSPWATFWYNLNFLVLVIPFGFYVAFRRERESDLLLIIFTLTAIYFCGSMIRLALLLAPAAALVGAYGLVFSLKPFRTVFWQRPILTRRRRRITPPTTRSFASATYLLLVVILLASTLSALNAANYMGSPEMTPGYRYPDTGETGYYRDYLETFSWMQTHTATDAVFLSWWDYGYWIRVMGDRPCVSDNATANKTQIGWVGRMLMETDPIEALKICRRFDVEYVLVHFGLNQAGFSGDEGKWQWMIRIAGEVFGNQVPDESYFWDETDSDISTAYKDPYFDTMIYNMLWLNCSAVNVELPADTWPEVDPTNILFDIFEPAYVSQVQLMKIYQVNYTKLDTAMEITGGNAYAVNMVPADVSLDGNVSSVVLGVENTGSLPIDIDEIDISSPTLDAYALYPEHGIITTTTGSFHLEPGESLVMNCEVDLYLELGMLLDVTVYAAGTEPRFSTSVQVPVRRAPDYELSVIESECYAYENGSVHVELENTGEGFCYIGRTASIDGEDISLVDAANRGFLLYTGDRIIFDFDATDADVTLTQGNNVTLEIFYMGYSTLYNGLNVTFDIIVEATPTPSAPSIQAPTTDTNLFNGYIQGCQFEIGQLSAYEASLSPSISSSASSDFFIARRYLP
ncbi:MAG: STT3 domain-containing protein [Promethearchaeota archaeon]